MGLRSEASGRYEKGINPARSEMAINRICQLLEEQGGATTAKGMLDEYPVKAEPQIINHGCKEINDYIGINMPKEQMIEILEALYFKVEEQDGKRLRHGSRIPSRRPFRHAGSGRRSGPGIRL